MTFGNLRECPKRHGGAVYDALIAATAAEHKLTLLSD